MARPGSPRFVTLMWLKPVTGTWPVIVTQSESVGPCGFSSRGQASASVPRRSSGVPLQAPVGEGTCSCLPRARHVWRPGLEPPLQKVDCEGGLPLRPLASRFCSAGERLVSHCVYCGLLWRHANHFWPTTPKSWSLNGHCHRPVVAQ